MLQFNYLCFNWVTAAKHYTAVRRECAFWPFFVGTQIYSSSESGESYGSSLKVLRTQDAVTTSSLSWQSEKTKVRYCARNNKRSPVNDDMLIRSIARPCVIKANDGPWTIDHYLYVWIRYCLSRFYALLSSLLFYTFFMSCWLRSLSLELFTSDERRFCKLSAWNNNKIAKLWQRSQEINKRQMQIRTLVYRLVKLKETYT